MLILVLLIMVCSLIGTVILIGICGPLSAAIIPPAQFRDDTPSIVVEESFREGRDFNINRERSASGGSNGEDTIRYDLRERIASCSVTILRSRGMSDEEIKYELLRDFSLTEKQIDEILAEQKKSEATQKP